MKKLASDTDTLIQANRRTGFEDGLLSGSTKEDLCNQLSIKNNLWENLRCLQEDSFAI